MFESSHPFLFFDYFRVPYRVARRSEGADIGLVSWGALEGTGAFLAWPLVDEQPESAVVRGRFEIDSVRFHGTLLSEGAIQKLLGRLSGDWVETAQIRNGHGVGVAAVWRESNGSLLLPFDPSEVIHAFWSERYREFQGGSRRRRARMRVVRGYYSLRPLIPRRVQIAWRRRLSRLQARQSFPRWPVETSLHDLYTLLFRWVSDVAGRPVPWLAPWPKGRTWALVLTHDVETRAGYDFIDPLRRLESQTGYRSSWNLVPRRYHVDDALVARLWEEGFEVGVHGLYHDGLDLDEARFTQRLPEMHAFARRWGARGFRSPATRRNWKRTLELGFEYDSSYPDTDPFDPDAGGCCSWLPFFVGDGPVELPITLPQDHTLFEILGHTDEQAWVEKAELLRAAGGMALIDTHPDYLLDRNRREAYARFLARFREDDRVWRALPADVSAWWRRRGSSSIQLVDGHWQVVGPAADEAEIRLAEPRAASEEGTSGFLTSSSCSSSQG